MHCGSVAGLFESNEEFAFGVLGGAVGGVYWGHNGGLIFLPRVCYIAKDHLHWNLNWCSLNSFFAVGDDE